MAELYIDKEGEEVEANLLTAANAKEVELWCDGVKVIEHDALEHAKTYVGINVDTPLGIRRASEGHWIVRSSDGTFSVYSPFTFNSWFKPVT